MEIGLLADCASVFLRDVGSEKGMLAIIYTLLFNAGLYFVVTFTGGPHFPGPSESSETIATYFQVNLRRP